MSWNGYYINLDRSAARRDAMDRQLSLLGLADRYRRFPAVDGRQFGRVSDRVSGGEAGIFKSHLTLIQQAAASGTFTHVIEDDVLISKRLLPCLKQLESGNQPSFDIIVTDTGIAPGMEQYRALKEVALKLKAGGWKFDTLKVLDLTKAYCWGLTSYILSPSGARKLLAEAEEEWARGPQLPIDALLARAAQEGRLSIGLTFPFLTWLNMDFATQSLAERQDGGRFRETVQQLARYPFFAERDIAGFLIPSLRSLIARAEQAGEEDKPPRWKRALANARFLLEEAEGLLRPA